MSFRQDNQHFGTLDLIMLVVLCGTVSSVIGASVAGFLHDDRPTRARTMAESLAFQIRQQHQLAVRPELAQMRGPASFIGDSTSAPMAPLTDGQMGKDPWGHPYFYTVLGKPTAANPTIVVWSEGPNGRLDSNIDSLSEETARSFRFHGDDIGFIAGARGR